MENSYFFHPEINAIGVSLYLLVKDLIQKHYEYTESEKAKMILDNWNEEKLNIVRVIPKMYKKLISEYKAV